MSDISYISALGYIGFEAKDPQAWAAFMTQVMGAMAADPADGTNRFRVDQQAWRIDVSPGDADDLAFVGLEVASAADLRRSAEQLRAKGIAFEPGSDELKADRGVMDLLVCHDPDGLRVEIYYGPNERQEIQFASPVGVSGFVTGAQGLGHFVLGTGQIDAMRAFYQDALGMQPSDMISMEVRPGRTLNLEFFHCNSRHHTLAMSPVGGPKRMHHFMLQVPSLDEVGFALDRAEAAGCHIVQTLGRHTNDQMISFYVATPSGIQIEYGFGGIEIDPAEWRFVRHAKTSSWGHKFQPAPR